MTILFRIWISYDFNLIYFNFSSVNKEKNIFYNDSIYTFAKNVNINFLFIYMPFSLILLINFFCKKYIFIIYLYLINK